MRSDGLAYLSLSPSDRDTLYGTQATFELRQVGQYVQLIEKPSGQSPRRRGPGAVRRRCQGLSSKALRHMVMVLMGLHYGSDAQFLTLTYDWSPDAGVVKRNLKAFLMVLSRRYAGVCGVWRLEAQKSGRLHLHLVCWNAPALRADSDFLAAAWHRIAAGRSDAHLTYGFHSEPLRDATRAGVYLAKEFGKTAQAVSGYTGRVWGLFGRRWIRRKHEPSIRPVSSKVAGLARSAISELNRVNLNFSRKCWESWRSRSWVLLPELIDFFSLLFPSSPPSAAPAVP